MGTNPMFTRREAAAFWITSGICEMMLAQLFWKSGVDSMGPDIDKRLKDPSLVSKITLMGFIYGAESDTLDI